ncbi:MAG: hypothetical protein JKY65_04385 [Planctomycetes bacterium]|nr:hypothetical protein [Planctomycetota bacterium]
MHRPTKLVSTFACVALLGLASASIGHAAPEDDEAAKNAFKELSGEQQKELRKVAELIGEGKSPKDPEVLKHVNAAKAYGTAANQAAKNDGMAAQIRLLEARIEGDKAIAERNREANDRPSVWDRAGSQILQALIAMLMDVGKQKLNDWINGGGKDDALLDQIRDLEDERIRLEEELAGGGPGGTNGGSDNNGLGEVITDPNGNTGYDTDGNGYVDIPLYPNGTPGSPGNESLDPTLSTPGSVLPGPIIGSGPNSLDKDDLSSAGLRGGGGIGRNGGPSGNSGVGFPGGGATPSIGAGGLAANSPGALAEGEDKDGDGIPDGEAGLGGELGEAGSLDPDSAKDGSSKGGDGDDEDGVATTKKFGRVIVLPKLEFGELAGNRKANDDWSEEWKDDSWDDSSDNGDFDEDWSNDEDWGGEWDEAAKKGKKAPGPSTTAEDAAAAELVDQIIRVETAVAEWRKLEAKAKEAGVDPYGFKDDDMGYRAAGSEEIDAFKDVRDKDGKIDLSKVDVWLIEEETWKDGEEPIRYRLNIDPDAIVDFEPIHGGVAMVEGVLSNVDVDDRVLDEIKGKVKDLEVHRVLLSAEKPPEDRDELSEDNPFEESDESPIPEDETKKGLETPALKPAPKVEPDSDDEDDWGAW